jgi:type II secretory pathway component PulM
MKNFMSQLHRSIDNLPERDKRVLLMAVPVVFILIGYLLVYRPISTYHFEAIQNMEAASDDYYWLRAQSPLAKSGYCGRLSNEASGKGYFEQQAKRDGLLISAAVSGAQTTITIVSAKGAAVLRYINNLACNGYKVNSLNVTRAVETDDKVSGRLVVDSAVVNN